MHMPVMPRFFRGVFFLKKKDNHSNVPHSRFRKMAPPPETRTSAPKSFFKLTRYNSHTYNTRTLIPLWMNVHRLYVYVSLWASLKTKPSNFWSNIFLITTPCRCTKTIIISAFQKKKKQLYLHAIGTLRPSLEGEAGRAMVRGPWIRGTQNLVCSR